VENIIGGEIDAHPMKSDPVVPVPHSEWRVEL